MTNSTPQSQSQMVSSHGLMLTTSTNGVLAGQCSSSDTSLSASSPSKSVKTSSSLSPAKRSSSGSPSKQSKTRGIDHNAYSHYCLYIYLLNDLILLSLHLFRYFVRVGNVRRLRYTARCRFWMRSNVHFIIFAIFGYQGKYNRFTKETRTVRKKWTSCQVGRKAENMEKTMVHIKV